MSKLLKILATVLLWLIKLINLLLRFLLACVIFLLQPFKAIALFFYYNLVLPIYRFYLFATKKLGWSRSKSLQPIAAILVNKNFIHVLVVSLAVIIVWENITATKGANAAEDYVVKTPLAKLVSDESSDADELITEEYQESSAVSEGQRTAYLDRSTVLNPQLGINTMEPAPEIDDEEVGLVQESPALTEDDITPSSSPSSTRTEPIEYVVKNGDTASSIASKFGISVNTILWENNLSAKGLIQPGDKLTILPSTGVKHTVKRNENLAVIANYYEIDQQKITESNNLATNAVLKVGQSLFIPGGRKIVVATVIKKPTGSTVTKPVYIDKKDPSTQIVSGGKMAWPTVGHTITQYYSWRHNGLDIANKTGTPIYAAGDGIIETAGWNSGGYGNQIIINHGGGKQTRYAHLSAFAVKVGETVSKGQNIGVMGSTGHSTGPHVHFEIMINGKRANPLSYVVY